MTCYYYTNPLHAALMAEQYGMKFFKADIFKWREKKMSTRALDEAINEGRFYIHPDSYPLLEPQVGDIILDDESEPRVIAQIRNDKVLWHEDEGWGWCYKSNAEIIQRDGLPFISPIVGIDGELETQTVYEFLEEKK